MSKGGAGKVYFVLYLAVILELLIIIVERDEAEEHLIAKQKESMRIVESILSQLQVGAGTEGINTRPQDQITIPPPGVNVKEAIGADIKPERKYLVEVGITDVTAALKQAEGEEPEEYVERLNRFLRLSNVSNLKYEILYCNEQGEETVPQDPDSWDLKSVAELNLEYERMEQQLRGLWDRQKGDPEAFQDGVEEVLLAATYAEPEVTPFKPGGIDEPEFYYALEETKKLGENAPKKRSFVVNFEPKEAGWYKLRFSSKANKILGVSIKEGQEFEIDPDEKVNIGTVQLKVKDLLKVREELEKNTEGLPPADKAKTDLEAFEKDLDAMIDATDDNAEQSRITLYGAIVKLTTPGIKAENAFDRNQGQMEFNIRVLKPAPQITDPKIADLDPVVRVFDGLSQLVLPMEVTPANGKTEFLQNPGNATTQASDAAASSSGSGSGRWTAKNLVIPISGNLTPRAEPYVFELVQKNGPKASAPTQCSVYVYSSKLDDRAAQSISDYMAVYWGQAIELVVTPPSGSSIKPNEFIMQFNFGAGSQTEPLNKLNVKYSDNIFVPAGTDEVKLSVAWKDPRSGEVVEIYNGSAPSGIKPPTLLTSDMAADPIRDNMSAEFTVKGIVVRPPKISEDGRVANVGDVSVEVGKVTVLDMRRNEQYRVAVIGKPRKISGNEYEVTLKLQGRTPLTRGQIKGNVELKLSANAMADGVMSKPRLITKTVSVSN